MTVRITRATKDADGLGFVGYYTGWGVGHDGAWSPRREPLNVLRGDGAEVDFHTADEEDGDGGNGAGEQR